VTVTCETAGSVGNQAAGTVLSIVSAIEGLQNQTVTVGTGGIAGGDDAEATEAWRARILLRIRKRGQSGNDDDYIEWSEANGAAPAPNVIPSWVGPGSVGVVFAMPAPTTPGSPPDRLVPTPTQVTAMQTALDIVRPVTAQVVAVAAVQTVVPLTIALATDSVINRKLATAAAQVYIAANAIGGLLDKSELEDAVLQAVGCGVEISVPAGNVQAAPSQMLTIGAVDWATYS